MRGWPDDKMHGQTTGCPPARRGRKQSPDAGNCRRHVALQRFLHDDHPVDVPGKHLPSDDPYLGPSADGPPRRSAAVHGDGRYPAHRGNFVRLSFERSRSEALRASTEHRSSLPLTPSRRSSPALPRQPALEGDRVDVVLRRMRYEQAWHCPPKNRQYWGKGGLSAEVQIRPDAQLTNQRAPFLAKRFRRSSPFAIIPTLYCSAMD